MALSREIRSIEVDGYWSISVNHALAFVDYSLEDFVTHCYQNQHDEHWNCFSNSSSLGNVSLDCENFAIFLDFLKKKGMVHCQYFFQKTGYYFSESQKEKLNTFFNQQVTQKLTEDDLDEALLKSIILSSTDMRQAIIFYGRVTFPLTKQIFQIACQFLREKRIRVHGFSKKYCTQILYERYFSNGARNSFKGRIAKENPNGAWDQLLCQALLARVEEFSRTFSRRRKKTKGVTIDEQTRRALFLLGLPTDQLPNPQTLKESYYRALKKYHPDLHQATLQQVKQKDLRENLESQKKSQRAQHLATQSIIDSYKLLLNRSG